MNHFFSCAFSVSLHDLRKDSSFQRAIAEGIEGHFEMKFVVMVMV